MTKLIFKNTLKAYAFLVLTVAMICCNFNKKADTKVNSTTISENESIPDSVVKFLISSASNDFLNHQPPTPIDFRNVKIGYIKSPNSEKTFLLCGEFLSQENKEWKEFTTIKTSGYEQYIGKTQYCQEAKMVLTDENLSLELKKKLTEK
ncbi:hypothetical protein L0657_08295 [Dyadobacter sp. CY345]|uniref:hypothetical protein n=1 Tax=Dyadobacter sp. CY345 TaxID=2909335 RepID=UPI001F3B6650|nr:hypothetical protein [Dyadobacter sp. CY345]MCF2443951.1 hypothetical protein [Dyadobacter sp. CY345]